MALTCIARGSVSRFEIQLEGRDVDVSIFVTLLTWYAMGHSIVSTNPLRNAMCQATAPDNPLSEVGKLTINLNTNFTISILSCMAATLNGVLYSRATCFHVCFPIFQFFPSLLSLSWMKQNEGSHEWCSERACSLNTGLNDWINGWGCLDSTDMKDEYWWGWVRLKVGRKISEINGYYLKVTKMGWICMHMASIGIKWRKMRWKRLCMKERMIKNDANMGKMDRWVKWVWGWVWRDI